MTKFSHITKDDVEKAIELYNQLSENELKRYGTNAKPTKHSDGYEVLFRGKYYPLKRLARIADTFSPDGKLPLFNTHSARNHLHNLGFDIILSRENEYGEITKKPYGNSKPDVVNDGEENLYPYEIDNSNQRLPEGAKKQILVNAYERNIKARANCLEKHGYQCSICDFSFGNTYGELFQHKIHVHHIKPLSEIQENYEVDPINDLIPVCPNCHMVLHSKGKNEVYSVEEVKQMILRNKS